MRNQYINLLKEITTSSESTITSEGSKTIEEMGNSLKKLSEIIYSYEMEENSLKETKIEIYTEFNGKVFICAITYIGADKEYITNNFSKMPTYNAKVTEDKENNPIVHYFLTQIDN